MLLKIAGLKCYQCTAEDSTTDLCLTHGGNLTECEKSHCTIFRQELQDPKGHVTHFERGCKDAESHLNKTIVTPFYKISYYFCSLDLCNGGDSLQEFFAKQWENNKSSSKPTGTSSSIVIVVPGIGSSSAEGFHSRSYISMILGAVILNIIWNNVCSYVIF